MKENITRISKILYSPKSSLERIRDKEIETSELMQTLLIILVFPVIIFLIVGLFRSNLTFGSSFKFNMKWIIYTVIVIFIFAEFIKDYLDGKGIQFFKMFKTAEWGSLVNCKSLLISIYFIIPLIAFDILENIFVGRSFVLTNTVLYLMAIFYSLFLLYNAISIVMSETVKNPISALIAIIIVGGINIIILSYILNFLGLGFRTNFSKYILPHLFGLIS